MEVKVYIKVGDIFKTLEHYKNKLKWEVILVSEDGREITFRPLNVSGVALVFYQCEDGPISFDIWGEELKGFEMIFETEEEWDTTFEPFSQCRWVDEIMSQLTVPGWLKDPDSLPVILSVNK